jgi:hypothetical protein
MCWKKAEKGVSTLPGPSIALGVHPRHKIYPVQPVNHHLLWPFTVHRQEVPKDGLSSFNIQDHSVRVFPVNGDPG